MRWTQSRWSGSSPPSIERCPSTFASFARFAVFLKENGLATDDIPIGSRIFVLADTFDAMTSDRPYRAALSVDASREEIISCSGTQFDPQCVQAFLLAFDKIVEIRFAEREEPSEFHAAAAPRQAAA